jgi:hypothetical protein
LTGGLDAEGKLRSAAGCAFPVSRSGCPPAAEPERRHGPAVFQGLNPGGLAAFGDIPNVLIDHAMRNGISGWLRRGKHQSERDL